MIQQAFGGLLALFILLGAVGGAMAQQSDESSVDEDIVTPAGIRLRLISKGQFTMGSRESPKKVAGFFRQVYNDELHLSLFRDEHPRHRVRITRPFYLGVFEVTRAQFRRFVTDTGYKTEAESSEPRGAFGRHDLDVSKNYSWRTPGFRQTDEHPVVCVSWNDALAFCRWASEKDGRAYRLPTEAEWEYACRAGTKTRYCSGDDPETLARVGNVPDATAKKEFPRWGGAIDASDGYAFTAPVGKFRANAFGLHDMHGNVIEWCADWYCAAYYAQSPENDPTGPDAGNARVLRGGSWAAHPSGARSAERDGAKPHLRFSTVGFRVATTLE